MMKKWDLYGFKKIDLEDARISIEKALGLSMESHESLYRCGNYYRFGNDGEENFILQKNFDPFDNKWLEEEGEGLEVILYVNETSRAEEIERLLTERIPEITLLRREVL
jgi:hypothetical protein